MAHTIRFVPPIQPTKLSAETLAAMNPVSQGYPDRMPLERVRSSKRAAGKQRRYRRTLRDDPGWRRRWMMTGD